MTFQKSDSIFRNREMNLGMINRLSSNLQDQSKHQNYESRILRLDNHSPWSIKNTLKIKKIENFKKMSIIYNEYWPS